MKRALFTTAAFGWLALSALSATNATAGVTNDEILNDATNTKQVVTDGMGLQAQRFSPLNQVNLKTIKSLVPAWTFSFGGEKQRGQEAQPLVADGVMYVTGSYSRMFAIDV